jgi:hypothetical protein
MKTIRSALLAIVVGVAACSTHDSGGGAVKMPPPVIGPCNALGPPGQWEKISPPGVLDAQAIALDPLHVGTMFLGASPDGIAGAGAGGLWKSTDCGATWSHANTGANGAAVDTASIWSLAIDFTDSNIIYAVGANAGPHGLLKSTNGGVDWMQLLPANSAVAQVNYDNNIASVTMDPTNPLHLVIGMHSNCSGTFAPACQAETSDGGATWQITHAPGTMWYEGGGPWLLDANSWIDTTVFNGMWLTEDRGATWRDITPQGVIGAVGGENTHRPFVHAPNGKWYVAGYKQDGYGGGLLESSDGRTWSVVPNSPHSSTMGGGIAFGDGHIFLSDRDSMTWRKASLADLSQWSTLPAAAGLTAIMGNGEGGVFLEYDEAHHVLYSSNFEGGLWRIVMP